MKCSVLMSVYKKDNPEFLGQALESIYEKQTVKPDEIVIVFDGPLTEELYTVIEDFKKGKEEIVFCCPQKENRGLGEALRIGAQRCTGDYIFRMDSDDISSPVRFEKQLEYIKNHPETDVLGSDIAEFCESTDEKMRLRVCPEKHGDIVKMGKRRNPMNHVSVCIKREALEGSGGYKTMLLAEDYYLWLRMIEGGCSFANINEALVYVRVGNGFIKRRGSKTVVKSWRSLQRFMLEHKMINGFEAFFNMVYIIGFTYCPDGLRRFAYDKFLRK